jgi:hypothetical protein
MKDASAEQKGALMTALSGTKEYQDIGKAGANSLGELMGLEGYRTPADRALKAHLASKPTLGDAGKVKAGTLEKLIGFGPAGAQVRMQGEILSQGDMGGPLGKGGHVGPLKDIMSSKKKRGAQQAANEAAKQAEYRAALNAWNAKTEELTRQRDAELQSYDPSAALKATPGYQYRYNTGLSTVAGAQNRTNMSQSGRALKELTNYGQDFASTEYGNEFNRRLQLMTGGQSLAGQTGGWNMSSGNTLASIAAGQGNAQADYYGNLNNVAQGSLANYTTNQNRQADRDAYGRRSSSYGTPSTNYNPNPFVYGTDKNGRPIVYGTDSGE